MEKKTINTRALVECAVLIALAVVLSMIKVYQAPSGGSVTAVSMLPIIIAGIRWGKKWSFGTALVYGVLQFFLDGYSISWIAIVLDYLLAFSMLGVSGLFYGRKYGVITASAVCSFLRFVVHFISGVTIWAVAGTDVWMYSLTYNGGYMLPEMVITTVVAALLYKPLARYIGPRDLAK